MMIYKLWHSNQRLLSRSDKPPAVNWSLHVFTQSIYILFVIICRVLTFYMEQIGHCSAMSFEFIWMWIARLLHECFFKVSEILLCKQVSCLIERLRGAARATLPRSQKAVYEVGAAVMEPLLVLLQTYKHQVMEIPDNLITWIDNSTLNYIMPLSGPVWKGEMW